MIYNMDPRVSLESAKMLQYRAALEEKLKQKKVSGVDTSKTDRRSKQKLRKTATGKLETTNDFDDDDVVPSEGATRDNGTLSSKLSRIIPSKKKKLENEPESLSDGGDDVEDEVDGSDDDLYNSHKRQRDLKLKMKAEKYSGNRKDVFEADAIVGGRRDISASMEKNRGLTRKRKPQNPRKNKRVIHEKALKRRDGQVRKPKKQTGPYGGEETGINARVTKSIKL